MIRGVLKTVRFNDLVPGAFYLQQIYREPPALMQVTVLKAFNDVDADRHFGLVFEPGGQPELSITELDTYGAYVLMPEVSVRVDPPSISGTYSTASLRSGTFFVTGDMPYAVAASGRLGHQIVNLANGVMEQRDFGREPWVSFSRWQLVVDENQEEVPIASFGDAPAVG